ncbi:transposase [Actinoplanes sp. NEAU-A12]|uniref:Transposase n=1 Tax=Actinoplanes sandaracinus TaxID=3045177 RepID=A0ABT6WFA6_9ACTN|nr:transposase [Actinoplanes sandaracinus]MDI6098426.1 transposase [Actinoplanes sandaracinus]
MAGRFCRVEPRRAAAGFVTGPLADLQIKTCWQLAEQAGHGRPDAMQRLLYRAKWDVDAVRDDVRRVVVDRLADPDGVLVVDETGDLKKSVPTVSSAGSRSAARTERVRPGHAIRASPACLGQKRTRTPRDRRRTSRRSMRSPPCGCGVIGQGVPRQHDLEQEAQRAEQDAGHDRGDEQDTHDDLGEVAGEQCDDEVGGGPPEHPGGRGEQTDAAGQADRAVPGQPGRGHRVASSSSSEEVAEGAAGAGAEVGLVEQVGERPVAVHPQDRGQVGDDVDHPEHGQPPGHRGEQCRRGHLGDHREQADGDHVDSEAGQGLDDPGTPGQRHRLGGVHIEGDGAPVKAEPGPPGPAAVVSEGHGVRELVQRRAPQSDRETEQGVHPRPRRHGRPGRPAHQQRPDPGYDNRADQDPTRPAHQ